MKNTLNLFGIIVLITVIGFSMVSCDDNGNGSSHGENTGPSGSGNRDSRVVLAAGYAWVWHNPEGWNNDGLIFSADGTFQSITDYVAGVQGVWHVNGTGTWSTSGNNVITLNIDSRTHSGSYTVTSTTLTIPNIFEVVFTRTPVTIP